MRCRLYVSDEQAMFAATPQGRFFGVRVIRNSSRITGPAVSSGHPTRLRFPCLPIGRFPPPIARSRVRLFFPAAVAIICGSRPGITITWFTPPSARVGEKDGVAIEKNANDSACFLESGRVSNRGVDFRRGWLERRQELRLAVSHAVIPVDKPDFSLVTL